MRRNNSFLRCAAICAGSALLSSAAIAGTFNADFNGGIPAGVNLQGNAFDYDHSFGGVGNSGVLKLAGGNSPDAVLGSQSGGAIIDDFDGGATIGGFDVTFDLYIGSGNGADGFSFFFGDFPDGAHSEEGPGNIEGLTVAFDVYNNATGAGVPEAPAIDLKWNNQILSHRLVGAASTTTGAQPLGTATTIRTQPTTGGAAVYWPVRIHVDTDGTVDVAYNNVVVFTNVPAFKPITEFTRGPGAARFGFAARTGGSTDNHWIDNLRITTVPLDSSSGQPTVIGMSPVALANATTGSPASGVGGATVRIQDNEFSVATNTVRFLYNNTLVTPTITREDDITTISYFGQNGVLPSGVGTVNVTYFTTSNPAVSNNFSYTFVVAPVTTLPASWAVTGVNTAAPGFKGRIYQMDNLRAPGDQNQTIMGERQLAFGYIDPATGQPYANIAELAGVPLDANGFFDIPGVINFEQGGGNAGNITGASNPSRPEEFFPGIPGQTFSTDNFALEFLGYVFLTEGGHRFGVYADDRVRLSFGPTFQTVGTPILAASTGANQEVIADVFVTQAGYYPIRLSYWEGGGGAHVELYYVLPNGQRILVNDPELTAAPRAYRDATGARPYISRVLPVENWIGASADDDVIIDITDAGTTLNPSTVIVRINGVQQSVTTSKSGNVTTILRDSSIDNLLPPGNNAVQLIYGFTEAGNAVTLTNNYTFVVAPYYNVLPAANRVPAGSVTDRGFNGRVNQIDRSLNANQGEGGRIAGGGDGNRLPWPEVQLAGGMINPTNGLAYPNLAQPGPNGNWTYAFDYVNFNQPTAQDPTMSVNSGLFQSAQPPAGLPGARMDDPMPGLPGGGTTPTGTSGTGAALGSDNYVMEVTTYLDLKRGVYVFGVNSDDGFVVSSAPNPRDTLGTLLGFFNGGRGNSGNLVGQTLPAGQTYPLITQGANSGSSVFSVIVPEDGIYPVRLLYWQGGGGVNLEFFTVDKQTGRVLLVNDTESDPSAVPAYRTYTGPERPYTKFSVSPTPWDNRYQQAGPGLITMIGRTRANAGANDIHNMADTVRPWADVAIGGIVANGVGQQIRLLLDGVEVPATQTTSGTDVTVSYRPPAPLAPNSTHTASLVYAGTTNTWSFAVQNYTTLNAADASPAGTGDPQARGFSVKVVQAASGQANTAARAEAQLAGTPADVSIPGPADGRYIVPGIINWSTSRVPGFTGVETGNFQQNTYGSGWPFPSYPDEPVPGLPGTGLTGDARMQNVTAEIFAWLELPAAGYYRFGGNADDGMAVKIGTPGVTNGTVIFTQDRGAGNQDIPFSFVAPQAGLYPVRFLWYQGGGGGSVEFFSYDASGAKIPVNDPNNPNAIKAYYRLSGTGGDQPVITVTRSGTGEIRITWTNGGTLEATTDLGANAVWTAVDNDGDYTTPTSGERRFFRVRR